MSRTSACRPRKHWGPALILLAAAVAVVPQLVRGNSCGHDFDVHLVSWLDCVNAWRHGIAYPHWAPSPNYGAGEPRFVFYPPLTWMLGGALGTVFPWNFVPIALTFLTLAGTGLATRALALEAFDEALDDARATLAGCVALFSGFALFTAYERCAFPEFAGGVLLPLLLLFALRDSTEAGCPNLAPASWRKGGKPPDSTSLVPTEGRSRAFDGSTALVAIMLAACWFSNLPLAVIATYLLAGVALLAALVRRSWAPVLRAALATPLGLGLAAIYWLPAAMERHWVDIRQATEDPGYNFENNWLFARHANPLLALHDVVLRQASWVAVSMIAVAVAGIVISWLRGTLPARKSTGQKSTDQKSTKSTRWWIPLAAIPIVAFFLMFPISRPVWNLLPEMHFLQYPWRLLEAVEAPMAIFFVAAVWQTGRRVRAVVVVACGVWFLAATVFAGTYFFQVCDDEDAVAPMLSAYHAGAGFEGMYEYEPPGGDDSSIAMGLPDACLVSDPSAALGKVDPDNPDSNPVWSAGENSCQATFTTVNGARTNPEHRRIRGAIPRPGYLVLRLLSYPAWRIRVNGQLVITLPKRDDGLMAVPVPQGPVELTVDWVNSPDVMAGRWLSGVSVLVLTVFCLFERRRKGSRLT